MSPTTQAASQESVPRNHGGREAEAGKEDEQSPWAGSYLQPSTARQEEME